MSIRITCCYNTNNNTPKFSYEPEALDLFNANSDVPEYWKLPTNKIIKTFKDQGVWDNPNFKFIVYIPTLDRYNTMMDIKSLTVESNYDNGSLNANESHGDSFPTADGWALYSSIRINTGIIPNTDLTLNDHCIIWATYDDEELPSTSTYNWGALDTTTKFIGGTSRANNGNFRVFGYSTGSVAQTTGDGLAGVYMNNRPSNLLLQAIKNGVVQDEIYTTAGSLPSREIWLGTFNKSGQTSYHEKTRVFLFGSIGSGLNTTQYTAINSAIQDYQNTLKYKKSFKTKQIIWDGNSFNCFHQSALQRKVQFELRKDSDLWHYQSPAISGKQTREMIAGFNDDVGAYYNGAYTENIYIISENSNDYWKNYQANYIDAVNDTKANHDTLVSLALNAGFKVLVLGGNARTTGASGFTQNEMNLGLDLIAQYERDQATIQGYTYLEPSTNRFVFRDDYASDSDYQTAMTAIYTGANFLSDHTHQTEEESFLWGQEVYNIINTI